MLLCFARVEAVAAGMSLSGKIKSNSLNMIEIRISERVHQFWSKKGQSFFSQSVLHVTKIACIVFAVETSQSE